MMQLILSLRGDRNNVRPNTLIEASSICIRKAFKKCVHEIKETHHHRWMRNTVVSDGNGLSAIVFVPEIHGSDACFIENPMIEKVCNCPKKMHSRLLIIPHVVNDESVRG